MMKAFLIVVSAVLLGGCAQVHQRQAVFSESEYAPYGGAGTSTVTGQAFLKTLSGDVKVGAGEEIALIPVTSYSTEWYDVGVVGNVELSPSETDPRTKPFHRFTRADGEGRFKFDAIPAGEYYLCCLITWYVKGDLAEFWAGTNKTGGIAHAKVKVAPGQTVSAVVTR